jgi:hypothetical protein
MNFSIVSDFIMFYKPVPQGVASFRFSDKNFVCTHHLSHSSYMHQPFYPTNLNTLMIYQEHKNSTVQFSLVFFYFLSYIFSSNCWTVVAYTTLQAVHIGDTVV